MYIDLNRTATIDIDCQKIPLAHACRAARPPINAMLVELFLAFVSATQSLGTTRVPPTSED